MSYKKVLAVGEILSLADHSAHHHPHDPPCRSSWEEWMDWLGKLDPMQLLIESACLWQHPSPSVCLICLLVHLSQLLYCHMYQRGSRVRLNLHKRVLWHLIA